MQPLLGQRINVSPGQNKSHFNKDDDAKDDEDQDHEYEEVDNEDVDANEDENIEDEDEEVDDEGDEVYMGDLLTRASLVTSSEWNISSERRLDCYI